MTRWALVIKMPVGKYQHMHLIDEVSGTREQALAALWHHAQTYKPPAPMNVTRRIVCQDGDGYLVINRGLSQANYMYEFRMHEVLWEWNAPAGPQ